MMAPRHPCGSFGFRIPLRRLSALLVIVVSAIGSVPATPHAAVAGARDTIPARFGGSDDDTVADMLLLPDGDLIVVGQTESEDLPGIAGAVDADYGAAGPGSAKNDFGDGFVARLSPDGSAVRWASYVGGAGTDAATAVAAMPDGGIVVVGHTSSPDFPATEGALDPQCGQEGCPASSTTTAAPLPDR
jgi:hypothetical protein